ncbi:MAG: hypothetical protein R2748_19695 [Bryobacterales bacterium]
MITGSGDPRISAITNAADYLCNTASSVSLSVFGERLANTTAGAVDTPLPTKLDEVCVTANGALLPLLYVSPGPESNAQMLYSLPPEPASVQVHTRDVSATR